MIVVPSHMSLAMGSHGTAKTSKGEQAGYENVREQHVG